jgi:hypothetical protein
MTSGGNSSSPIPAPFTSRRLYNYDSAAVLMRQLRAGRYARILKAEDQISAIAALARLDNSSDQHCRGMQKNGIV